MIGLATNEDLEAVHQELDILKGQVADLAKNFNQLVEKLKATAATAPTKIEKK